MFWGLPDGTRPSACKWRGGARFAIRRHVATAMRNRTAGSVEIQWVDQKAIQ
jgi:hypothetical protein